MDLKLEVVVVPFLDVDRTTHFSRIQMAVASTVCP